MQKKWMKPGVFALIATLCGGAAHAFQFQLGDSVRGNLDMQLTLGAGIRMSDRSAELVGDPKIVPGANTAASSNGDDGDLNYKQHDLYTTYLKFTPELLLKFPDNYKFMARATALYDFKAADTRRTDLEDSAEDRIARDFLLLDLWVSKDLNIGDQRARIRVGNQVVSWGESLFAIGGVNSPNSLDFPKLAITRAHLK